MEEQNAYRIHLLSQNGIKVKNPNPDPFANLPNPDDYQTFHQWHCYKKDSDFDSFFMMWWAVWSAVIGLLMSL